MTADRIAVTWHSTRVKSAELELEHGADEAAIRAAIAERDPEADSIVIVEWSELAAPAADDAGEAGR